MTTNAGTAEPLLLKLPPELRNYIYELALVEPYTMDLEAEDVAGRIAEVVLQPDLTRTCKQIRQEALPIFYGRNTFEIYVCSDWPGEHAEPFLVLPRWLHLIGAANRQTVQRVVVCSMLDEKSIRSEFDKQVGEINQDFAVCWEGVTEDRYCNTYPQVGKPEANGWNHFSMKVKG